LIAVRVKCHGPIYIREICAVKNVVSLPSQLDCTVLSPTEILEKRHIGVEDAGEPNEISL
jgi:hypothetical protein